MMEKMNLMKVRTNRKKRKKKNENIFAFYHFVLFVFYLDVIIKLIVVGHTYVILKSYELVGTLRPVTGCSSLMPDFNFCSSVISIV